MTTTTTTSQTLSPWKGAAIGIGAALAANLLIFFIGNALMDGSIQVVEPGATAASDLPMAALIAASIVPLLVGAAGLWVLAKVRPDGALRLWSIIAMALAVLSVAQPFMLDVSTGSQVALSVMHVATGAAAVAGQAVAARSN